MLLVLMSLPSLPTPSSCAQAVAKLNSDKVVPRTFATYNLTDCMTWDFDPKNQYLDPPHNCTGTEYAAPYEAACTAHGGAVYNETRWIRMAMTEFKHSRESVYCLPPPDACSQDDIYSLAKSEMNTWCQQFSMFLVDACSVGWHLPQTVEASA